jgi:hypothetical protein
LIKVRAALHAILASAGRLRLCTLRGITEALTPDNAVIFIAKAMHFHLQVRRFGLQNNNRGN